MKFKFLVMSALLATTFLCFGMVKHPTAYEVPEVWDVLRSEFKMSHEVNRPEVQEQIRWLAAHPSYVQKVCRQSEPYIYHILKEIRKRKLPGELALVPMIESAYDPFAYSGVGAAGLWQLMPGTGSELGLKQDWWYDGRRSIGPSTDAALNYLLYLNKFFNGNWVFAIAAYDAGEGTIDHALKATNQTRENGFFWKLPIPRETKVYVPRFLALAEIIRNPQRYHIELPSIAYAPYFQEVNIGSQIDLNHAAKMAGISYKELIKLNPGYNRWTTAPYKPFHLLIPTEKVERFNLNLASVPEDKRVSWTKHSVKKGDSINNIAIRYHTTANLIKQLNQLTTNSLRPNQEILIPSTKNTTVVAQKPVVDHKAPLESKIVGTRNHRVIHIVQATDSIAKIQNMYGVSAREIQQWNKLSAKKPLRTGQQLVIWKRMKQPKTYKVQAGDSLSVIAKRNQTKVNQILALNPGLRKNRTLSLGQKILVG